jgi:hypothetical protein
MKIYIKIFELAFQIAFFYTFQTHGGVGVYSSNAAGRKNQNYKGYMIKGKRRLKHN